MRESIKRAIDGLEGGPGILEMSHRSSQFDQVINEASAAIRRVYELPETHEILFLQGGASLQFAMIPFNLGTHGGYLTTGEWSERALEEAKGLVHDTKAQPLELTSAAPHFDHTPRHIPQMGREVLSLDYLHLTSNNTIYGTQYHELPLIEGLSREERTPGFVVDASSDIFSRPIDWSRVDLLYAGAQKNAGPSGVSLVIAHKEITRRPPKHPFCPKILAYQTHAEKGSLYHTPNTLGVYAVGEVAKWVESMGGVKLMSERAQKRSNRIYDLIDRYDLYRGHAHHGSRSMMNITFHVTDPKAESRLLELASQRSMWGLRGHRSVGGLRASLYNAVPDVSIDRLCELLEEVGEESTR